VTSAFDLLTFVGVVLQGAGLVAQSILLGSAAFVLLVLAPLDVVPATRVPRDAGDAWRGVRWALRAAAIATCVLTVATVLVTATLLAASLNVPIADVAGARFVVAGAIKALAAIAMGCAMPAIPSGIDRMRVVACVAGACVLASALADTHAAARLDDEMLLLTATGVHEAGAALWLGALPCFRLALRGADMQRAAAIGARVSAVAASGVALIVAGAVAFAVVYIGSVDAIYGTAYGAMDATKSALLALLLALGFANRRAVRRMTSDARAIARVMRFVEVEMGLGVAVLMAAASITSTAPSVDVGAQDRVSRVEVIERFTTWPRRASPAPRALGAAQGGAGAARNAEDRAWSEYNHHWAGLLVTLMGALALAQRTGRARWAAHWPLLFLVLAAFLLFRADPEVWPLGPLGPVESLRDPEIVQHRAFVAVIVAFGVFEWRVRTGRVASLALACVFPLAMAAGGTLLLTHSHAVDSPREALLIELSHLPIALLGIVAAGARWLEVAAPREEGRWAGWLWPVAFVLVGGLLLDYREGLP
jgi:putative copper resistance protein D